MRTLRFVKLVFAIRLSLCTVGIVFFAGQQEVQAAFHEAFPSGDVEVHYVHLTGHGGDNETERNVLKREHGACVERNRIFGKAAKPLADEEIPAVPHQHDVEIYYARNRTLLAARQKVHRIERETCALAVFEYHNLRLSSGAGRCDIDLLKREARGQCDGAMHRRAPAASSSSSATESQLRAIDMKKVPPHMRETVQAAIDRLKDGADSAPKNGARKSATETIAGVECEVSRYVAVYAEKCIANPKSNFVIPASPFNAERPGLLLEMKSAAMSLRAEQVTLHIRVSDDIFVPPAGMKSPTSGRSGK
ncbi:MAG: hypothetical protein ACREX0_00580 [Noviherbaspirillum sp.]